MVTDGLLITAVKAFYGVFHPCKKQSIRLFRASSLLKSKKNLDHVFCGAVYSYHLDMIFYVTCSSVCFLVLHEYLEIP